MDTIEKERERNAAEMDKRIERIRQRMNSGTYPMEPGNPLLKATDEEIRAYIRKRRAEFEAKHGTPTLK